MLDGFEVLVDEGVVVTPDAILMREVGIVTDERPTCRIWILQHHVIKVVIAELYSRVDE